MAASASELSLFVYGSLKRGQSNHARLRRALFVGEARTEARFALRVIGGYPALVPGARAVEGELYRIAMAELGQLDEFEGDAYLRREVQLDTGSRVLAYVARRPSDGVPFAGDRWPNA